MKRYRVGEFVEPPIQEHDGDWVRYSDHVAALTTARKEARDAAFKEATKIVKEQPSTTGDWMTRHDVAANLRRKIVWAIEAAANRAKGDGKVTET